MKTILYATITAASAIFSPGILYSQETGWEITETSGETYSACSLDSLSGTMLYFHQDSSCGSVAVNSIARLRLPQDSVSNANTLIGTLIGGVVGGVAGYAAAPGAGTVQQSGTGYVISSFYTPRAVPTTSIETTPSQKRSGTLIGVLLGGTRGYVIGSLVSQESRQEKLYEMQDMSPGVKLGVVWSIVRENSVSSDR